MIVVNYDSSLWKQPQKIKSIFGVTSVHSSCAFLFVEAIPFSESYYMMSDMDPIKVIWQLAFWPSTVDG